MGRRSEGKTVRINVKITPQLEAEIREQLMIHNGRCNSPAWTLSDFLVNAIAAYLKDLRRARKFSAARHARRRKAREASENPDPLADHNNRMKERCENAR